MGWSIIAKARSVRCPVQGPFRDPFRRSGCASHVPPVPPICSKIQCRGLPVARRGVRERREGEGGLLIDRTRTRTPGHRLHGFRYVIQQYGAISRQQGTVEGEAV